VLRPGHTGCMLTHSTSLQLVSVTGWQTWWWMLNQLNLEKLSEVHVVG
jgi:hypothetical protein